MGQREVLAFLKKHPDILFNAKVVSINLKTTENSASKSLNKLTGQFGVRHMYQGRTKLFWYEKKKKII